VEHEQGYSGSLSPKERLRDMDERMERIAKHAQQHGMDIQSLLIKSSRTQEELNGHEQACQVTNEKIWKEIGELKVAMEKHKGEVNTQMEKRKGELNVLAAKVAGVVFLIQLAVQYWMKHS